MFVSIIKFKEQRGFTLYLATLIASLMLALGTAMFVIAQKDVRISAMSRDSQFAFYAADAAAECALYLHFVKDAFATSTRYTDMDNAKCDGKSLLSTNYPPATPKTYLGGSDNTLSDGRYSTTYIYNISGIDDDEYCVSVQVLKDDLNFPQTQINVLGYNVSCEERPTATKILERAVRMNL